MIIAIYTNLREYVIVKEFIERFPSHIIKLVYIQDEIISEISPYTITNIIINKLNLNNGCSDILSNLPLVLNGASHILICGNSAYCFMAALTGHYEKKKILYMNSSEDTVYKQMIGNITNYFISMTAEELPFS